MTQHEDIVRLHHMLDNAQEAISMIAGKDRSDLQQNRMLELALVRTSLGPRLLECEIG